jgi:hypothetical protein
MTNRVSTIYQHVQESASDSWAVEHNLGGYPTVEVFIMVHGELQKVIPRAVTYVDANSCTVSFTAAYTGFAQVC